jgi:hypothetical protein
MLDSARRECLDRLLITGGRHLRLALTECTVRQPHRALQHSPPAGVQTGLLWAQASGTAQGPAHRVAHQNAFMGCELRGSRFFSLLADTR